MYNKSDVKKEWFELWRTGKHAHIKVLLLLLFCIHVKLGDYQIKCLWAASLGVLICNFLFPSSFRITAWRASLTFSVLNDIDLIQFNHLELGEGSNFHFIFYSSLVIGLFVF